MQSVIDVKLKKLKKWFSLRDNVIVAYSGGVDSSLLAQVAYSTLGSKAIAITADSPSIARKDLADAKELARSIGIQHIVVNTFEINNPDYFTNPENRCYFCKEELFRTIKPDGLVYAEIPFIGAYHMAPHDYQRYTISGIESLFKRHGLSLIHI